MKKFIIRILIKSAIFIIISSFALTLLESPIINNEIALGQMENSNEAYLILEFYNKLINIIRAIYSIVVVVFIVSVGCDCYKFIKSRKGNKNENA